MSAWRPLHVCLHDSGNGISYELARFIQQHTPAPVFFFFSTVERGRFMIPCIMQYGNTALFLDESYSGNGNITGLFRQHRKQEICAVYVPDGQQGSPFPSAMLFWNKYCETLTPSYVYSASVEQLAPVVWAGGAQNVGTLEV